MKGEIVSNDSGYRRRLAQKPRAVPKLLAGLACIGVLSVHALRAEPVTVRFAEGLVHGFLTLTAPDGSLLADGDMIQHATGTRVTSRLVFHFKDGSLEDETTVFSERQQFRLISDHLVQKGPAFPQPLEMSIDGATGQTTIRYTDDHGQAKQESERFTVPDDLANGLLLVTMLKNVRPQAAPKSLSLIVATPKPRLVKLAVSVAGDDTFLTGGAERKAIHYVLKVQIGGLSGLVAPLVGKQPPDSHVWILGGEAPAFVRAEEPLYAGAPLVRIDLVNPVWPKESGK
jgi:hypothetical protein